MEKKRAPAGRTPDTSWGGVAEWYGDYLEKEGTYQSEVIKPNIIRLVAGQPGEKILDLACGQGYFSREFAKSGATIVGCDIAAELIESARKNVPGAEFVVTPATDLSFAQDASYDTVVCVLAIQNIEDMATTFTEVRRILRPGGRFLLVLNHPAFRVLKRSGWGWDAEAKIQYRRVDGYISPARVEIEMHPGADLDERTISYHRSLQDFFKAFSKAGFVVSRLEEWTSHKVSEKGPRQAAEDTARKEIPLFMAIEGRVWARE